MEPNLFNYATSELSQDAFLAWLFSWANPLYIDNKNLHKASKQLIKHCFDLADEKIEVDKIQDIVIYKQYENIDLWIEIITQTNSNCHIIIEDKTKTKPHDNQLKRYKDVVEGWIKGNGEKDKYTLIYYKSGSLTEDEKSEVLKSDFKILEKQELLDIFKNCSHPVLTSYKEYYEDAKFELLAKQTFDLKNKNCITSFYKYLLQKIKENGIRYIPRRDSNYYCFWFNSWFEPKSKNKNFYCYFYEFEWNSSSNELHLFFKVKSKQEINTDEFAKILEKRKEEFNNYQGLEIRWGKYNCKNLCEQKLMEVDISSCLNNFDIDDFVEKLKELLY